MTEQTRGHSPLKVMQGIVEIAEAGQYVRVDGELEHSSELGGTISPLETLSLRIQDREKYAEVVSPDEMILNKGFASELDQLKREKKKLEEGSPQKWVR